MNIFAVHPDPIISARSLCNQHVLKMVVEGAQMLSTAHRVTDGVYEARKSKTGRTVPYWRHPDPGYEFGLYASTHDKHICTKWAMANTANYNWLFEHTLELAREYTLRYEGKRHKTERVLLAFLSCPPVRMPVCGETSPFPQAMPEIYRVPGDPVQAYRNFYLLDKSKFATWKGRNPPEWWTQSEVSA